MCKCPFRSQTDTRPVVHRVWLTGKYHLPALDPDDTAAPRHAHSATQQPPKHSIWTSKNHSRLSISLTRADAPAKKMQEDAAPAAGAQPPAPPPGTATSRRAAAGERATCTALPSTHTHPSNMPCEAAACAQPPAAAAPHRDWRVGRWQGRDAGAKGRLRGAGADWTSHGIRL